MRQLRSVSELQTHLRNLHPPRVARLSLGCLRSRRRGCEFGWVVLSLFLCSLDTGIGKVKSPEMRGVKVLNFQGALRFPFLLNIPTKPQLGGRSGCHKWEGCLDWLPGNWPFGVSSTFFQRPEQTHLKPENTGQNLFSAGQEPNRNRNCRNRFSRNQKRNPEQQIGLKIGYSHWIG